MTELTARLEHQLSLAQRITHIGSWEWDPASNALTWSDELYRIYGLEPRCMEITFERFLHMLHPNDRERIRSEVRRAIESGGRFAWAERIVRPDGSVRDLDTIGEVVRNAEGAIVAMIGTCRDVTEQVLGQKLQNAEARVLEMIAAGVALGETLEAIVLAIEEQAPETLGSILLLEGDSIRHGAAPHLPPAYNRAIDGQHIGPRAGSCGTAAFLRRAVFVADIERDALWTDYRELAREHGLCACWSTPIFSSDGRVLGTFALYYRVPREPDPQSLALIERATHIAGIAIQRTLLVEQLRALSARIEAVREEERTGVAREIHDELGQSLTALKMDVAWLLRRKEEFMASDAIVDKLRDMSLMTDRLIDQVRRISSELRPGVLDDLGLVAAIEWQTHEFERRTNTACRFQASVHEVHFERDLSTAVFRILQEALTNVARHAAATRVDVWLEQGQFELRLEVRDDGNGISSEAVWSGTSLGLIGIRERARRLGGRVSISGAPNRGTLVVVELPLPATPAAP